MGGRRKLRLGVARQGLLSALESGARRVRGWRGSTTFVIHSFASYIKREMQMTCAARGPFNMQGSKKPDRAPFTTADYGLDI